MPSRHVGDLYDLSGDEFAALFAFARRIGAFVAGEFRTPSFDWTIQNGEPAGQTVDHVHLHIIPRHAGDLPDPGDWYPRLAEVKEKVKEGGFEAARVELDESEQAEVAQALASKWDSKFTDTLW